MPLPSGLAAVPSLSDAKLEQFARLSEGLAPEALLWLSGYAAGLAARASKASPPAVVAAHAANTPAPLLTIVYGSQTGNSRRVAESLAAELEGVGVASRLFRADAYPLPELRQERFLQVVISTQGDGEPPDDAREFFEFVLGRKAPTLSGLSFGVFGLGDSSYPKFCEAARALDARLAELGATRWHALAEADLDIDSTAAPWLATTTALARRTVSAGALTKDNVTPLRAPTVSRDRPFFAEVLTNQRITGRNSDRDTRHLELSLEGSGLDYEPGDSLGIWPSNPPRLVDAVLRSLRLDGDELVEQATHSRPLRGWLETHRELTRLDRSFIARHAALTGNAEFARILEPGNAGELRGWLENRQPIDLLQGNDAKWSATDLVAALRPLAPRLYSIASSRKVVGNEAHLTVAHVEYAQAGEQRWGAASHFLATRDEGASAPIYIERNERFRLPADGSRDIIMVGAGTGVAPFRAFVQERVAVGASGRNWLFFGNPRLSSDFLYQLEWQRALKSGQLHRIDVAFSRDRANKVYVQQRLSEQAVELRSWLDGGAYLYVCGNAATMARDVHATLLEILGKDRDEGAEILDQLQRQGRYLRDVY